jgi:hypothetical protein
VARAEENAGAVPVGDLVAAAAVATVVALEKAGAVVDISVVPVAAATVATVAATATEGY